MRFSAFLAALLLCGTGAGAGEWETLPQSAQSECDFRFSGRIQAGDLTGFISTLESSGLVLPRICLNSEGGSLAEIRDFLGQMAQNTEVFSFSTRIERDAACLSSCAILFMFGQTYGANSPYPMRIMEPGARLAFASAFAAPEGDDRPDPAEGLDRAQTAAALLVASTYRALTTAGPAIPPEILSLTLGAAPEARQDVDTIGELRLLGIDIANPEEGMVLPNESAAFEQASRRICAASHVLTNRQAFVPERYDFAALVAAAQELQEQGAEIHHLRLVPAEGHQPARIVTLASGPYHVPLWFSAGAALFCQVEFFVEQMPEGYRISRYRVGFGPYRTAFETRLATDADITTLGLDVGLLPIDHPYR